MGTTELVEKAKELCGKLRFAEAMELLQGVESTGRAPAERLELCKTRLLCLVNLRRLESLSKAAEELEDAIRRTPRVKPSVKLDALYLICGTYIELGERGGARAVLGEMESLQQKGESAAESLVRLGSLNLQLCGNRRALELLELGYEKSRGSFRTAALLNLTTSLLAAGEAERARECLQTLEDANPQESGHIWLRCRLKKAVLALLQGRLQEVGVTLNETLEAARATDDRRVVQVGLKLQVHLLSAKGDRALLGAYLNSSIALASVAADREAQNELFVLRALLFETEPGWRLERVEHHPELEVAALYAQSAVCLRAGDSPGAEQYAQRAAELALRERFEGSLALCVQSCPEPAKLFYRPLSPVLERCVGEEVQPVRLVTLGRFGVHYGNVSVGREGLTAEKYRQLLVYLSTRRTPPTKREAAAAIWRGAPWQKAYKSLVNGLSGIRRSLRSIGVPLPRIKPKGVVSLGYPLSTDVGSLEELCKAARAVAAVGDATKLYEKAIELYKGEFLPGADYVWAEDIRWVARSRFIEAAMYVGGKRLESGGYEGALSLAERVIREDPLAEEGYRLADECLMKLGRRSEARRLKAQLARHLAELEG